ERNGPRILQRDIVQQGVHAREIRLGRYASSSAAHGAEALFGRNDSRTSQGFARRARSVTRARGRDGKSARGVPDGRQSRREVSGRERRHHYDKSRRASNRKGRELLSYRPKRPPQP